MSFRRIAATVVCVALMASCDDKGMDPPPNGGGGGGQSKSASFVSAKDNTLYEDAIGQWSNGIGEHMFVGKTNGTNGVDPPEIRRALVMFDLSSIPTGATVDSVVLVLNMSQTRTTDATDVTLHRVTQDWGEAGSAAQPGEGGGANSQPNDATWIHTFYDTDTWTNAGGDFVGAASATTPVSVRNQKYTWGSTSEMVADVQGWVADPATNFGWLLRGDEVSQGLAKRFDTRNNTDADLRPMLTVHYTEP